MDLKEIEWEVVDWIRVPKDRDQRRALANTAMKVGVP
jgi:hypothetical protein